MSAKWPGLPAFLAHLAIGACLAMPVNTFVQYYFNGRLMAQLPQWDASIYSHAAIMPVYVLGEPITALVCTTEPFTVSNDGYLELKKPTTAIMATGVIANRVHVRWKWLEGTNDYEAGVWNTSAAAVIWSNYDLVDASGTVYLAASEPVPRVKREPVAYLYNGARTPKLPDIPTDYPYVSMYYNSALKGMRFLFFSKSPCYMVEGENNWYVPAPYMRCKLNSAADYNEWMEPALDDSTEDYKNVLPKWANHDVLNADGTTYFTTSDPVPVYE